MKIEVTWNKSDNTKATVGFDGTGTDEEMEIHKAIAGAQAHFHQETGAAPPLNQLSARVVDN